MADFFDTYGANIRQRDNTFVPGGGSGGGPQQQQQHQPPAYVASPAADFFNSYQRGGGGAAAAPQQHHQQHHHQPMPQNVVRPHHHHHHHQARGNTIVSVSGGGYAAMPHHHHHHHQHQQHQPYQQRSQQLPTYKPQNQHQQQQTVVKKLVGVSTELERDFTRDEPKADQLRPLPVLKTALAHIKDKALGAASVGWASRVDAITWLFGQLKGMRQDLKVQGLENSFAVGVYELHARIALQLGDLSEYVQCQAALKSYYEDLGIASSFVPAASSSSSSVSSNINNKNSSSNAAAVNAYLSNSGMLAVEEFTAYRLLYLAVTGAEKGDLLELQIQALAAQNERFLNVATQAAALRKGEQRTAFEKTVAGPAAAVISENNKKNNKVERAVADVVSPTLEQVVLLEESWVRIFALCGGPNSTCRHITDDIVNPTEVDRILRTDETAGKSSSNSSNSSSNSSSRELSSMPALCTLLRRPSIVALLDAIGMLNRGDGRAFLSAITALVRRHPHLQGLLFLTRISLNRLRTRWLIALCRGLKGTTMLPQRVLAEALGFGSGADRAMGDAIVEAIGTTWRSMHEEFDEEHHHKPGGDGAASATSVSAGKKNNNDKKKKQQPQPKQQQRPPGGKNKNKKQHQQQRARSPSDSPPSSSSSDDDEFNPVDDVAQQQKQLQHPHHHHNTTQKSWREFFHEIKYPAMPKLEVEEDQIAGGGGAWKIRFVAAAAAGAEGGHQEDAQAGAVVAATTTKMLVFKELNDAVIDYVTYLQTGSLKTPTTTAAGGGGGAGGAAAAAAGGGFGIF